MKKKLTSIMALIATLPLLLFSVFSLSSNAEELQKKADQIGMDNVIASQYEISMLINQNIDLLKVLARNDILQSEMLNPDAVKSLLIASAKAHSELTTLSYMDATGQQRARNDTGSFVNLADRDYFKQALKTGKPVVSDIVVSKDDGHQVIVICYPILDTNQKVIGAVNASLDLAMLSDFVTKLSNSGQTTFILDHTGKILAHPDKAYILKDLSKSNFIQQALKGQSGTDVITDNGKKMIVSYKYDSQTGWVIAYEQLYSDVMAEITKIRTQSILILVVTVLVAGAIGGLAYRLHRERKQLEEMAYHDPLTGLYNRIAIQQKLEHFVASNHSHEPVMSCLFIDVDDFKFINDTYGHDVGDECLKEIATQLKASVSEETHLAARLGGDEFIVALLGTSKEQAELFAQDLQSALTNSVLLKLNITFSIGIANFPEDCQTIAEILQQSDIAMYQAKRDGKNRVRVFSSDSKSAIWDVLQLEKDLRKAWNKSEFHLVYQPQVDVASEVIVGLEALLRWHHPERGIVLPDTFIPILERTGQIIPVGQWVLQEAARMCREWQQIGFPNLRISVNVSPIQLQDPHFVTFVRDALYTANLSADSLELEITESIAMNHNDTYIQKLQELKAIGIRLAMDDFGKGYSSLNYLIHYPIDVVKLDKSFVQALQGSSAHAVLIKSLIDLAHSLRLELVAEGVENLEQLEFCKMSACDAVQGYFTGQPMPEEAVGPHLRENYLNMKPYIFNLAH